MTEPGKKLNSPNDSVILLSGGIDSTTLLYNLVKTQKRHPLAIVARYGQRHSYETKCAVYHANLLDVPIIMSPLTDLFTSLDIRSALTSSDIEVPDLEDVLGDPQPVTYVPNRNQVLIGIAAMVAESIGATSVFYGAQKSDVYGYWDTTPLFLQALNNVYNLNRKNVITIQAPFIMSTKADIVKLGLSYEIDYSQTWSCYEGNYELGACGKCATCRERMKAFIDNGITDPIEYQEVQS